MSVISEIYLHLDILLNFERDIPVRSGELGGRRLTSTIFQEEITFGMAQVMESPPSTIQKIKISL